MKSKLSKAVKSDRHLRWQDLLDPDMLVEVVKRRRTFFWQAAG